MVLLWTRFVPKHYDFAANSSAPLPDEVSKQMFTFMRLLVDIRLSD